MALTVPGVEPDLPQEQHLRYGFTAYNYIKYGVARGRLEAGATSGRTSAAVPCRDM